MNLFKLSLPKAIKLIIALILVSIIAYATWTIGSNLYVSTFYQTIPFVIYLTTLSIITAIITIAGIAITEYFIFIKPKHKLSFESETTEEPQEAINEEITPPKPTKKPSLTASKLLQNLSLDQTAAITPFTNSRMTNQELKQALEKQEQETEEILKTLEPKEEIETPKPEPEAPAKKKTLDELLEDSKKEVMIAINNNLVKRLQNDELLVSPVDKEIADFGKNGFNIKLEKPPKPKQPVPVELSKDEIMLQTSPIQTDEATLLEADL